MLETLESRRLMSVTAILNGEYLAIVGNNSPDQVKVDLVGQDIVVQQKVQITPTSSQWKVVNYFPSEDVGMIVVETRGGNDVLTINANVTQTAVVSGGAGNDLIRAGGQYNRLSGNEGNDTIYGGGTVDTLAGGSGNDVIYGNGGGDLIDGEDGNDSIYGGNGNDNISGSRGDDVLSGDAGADSLYGGIGADSITGGTGVDVMSGGDGNDFLNAIDSGLLRDSVNGGAGHDTARVDRLKGIVWDKVTNVETILF